jgi:hypothetical protein
MFPARYKPNFLSYSEKFSLQRIIYRNFSKIYYLEKISVDGGVILYAYATEGRIADIWAEILILYIQNTEQENRY